MQITNKICNIVKVKVAKSSEIADFSDFETKGEELEFTTGKNVNITYTAPEDNTYVFYIEDELGNRKMIEKRITSEEKVINVEIAQDENLPGNLIIRATNSICNIVEMKIAIGENIDLAYFENNGEEISINEGKEVTANYTVDENCTVNVFIKDEQGYTYMYSKQIIGVEEPEPVPNEPPEITLTQNADNLKQIDVRVRDTDSYIDEVKWAKESQSVEYFATNGTRIGQGSVGSSINTHFNITETGIYTVYAKDDDGNEVVKEINITNIETTEEPDNPEEPEKDTTPPEVSGVENQKIYNQSVIPTISDENLKSVVLTKGGIEIETYKSGDILENDGEYVLTAIDEAGNKSIVEFIIDKTAPEIEINQQHTDNQNISASIIVEDDLTFIDKVKIAEGEQNIDYFENNGQELDIENNSKTVDTSINISKNGIYTVFAKDRAGNSKIQTFEVTTITDEPEVDDTTPPTVNTTNEFIEEDKTVKVIIDVVDTQSPIKTIKIATGEQNIEYFENDGTTLNIKTEGNSARAEVGIKSNGTYTIYAEDEKGNSVIKVINITEIVEEPEPEPEPDDDTITSSEYQIDIDSNYISKIISETNLTEFKNNISTEIGYKVVNSSGEEIQDSDLIGTGYKLITDTNKEYMLIVTGDLNGDGNINLVDLSRLRKYHLKIITLQDEYAKAGDANYDNEVDLIDLSRIRKAILKIIEL